MSPGMQLIVRTGQAPKLAAGIALLLGGFVLMLSGALLLEPLTMAKLLSLSIATFILGAAGFAYLCLAIRCPDCGARWLWLLASRRPGSPAHFDFRSDRCPLCANRE